MVMDLAMITTTPKRWTPKITIREDNTTCISTNTSGKNGQMKELERAFGVYVSWNSARLSSGDYEITYTRSHDMSADVYTKGFDDAGLFQRLLLLTNLYSPEQWESGLMRPEPLLGDKSPAKGSPLFDPSLINSQWSIYLIGVAQEQDNRKAMKKKPPKKKASSFTIEPCWYPNVPGVDGEYRTDCGVTNLPNTYGRGNVYPRTCGYSTNMVFITESTLVGGTILFKGSVEGNH